MSQLVGQLLGGSRHLPAYESAMRRPRASISYVITHCACVQQQNVHESNSQQTVTESTQQQNVHECNSQQTVTESTQQQNVHECNSQQTVTESTISKLLTGRTQRSALALLRSATHCRITVDPPNFSALLSVV